MRIDAEAKRRRMSAPQMIFAMLETQLPELGKPAEMPVMRELQQASA